MSHRRNRAANTEERSSVSSLSGGAKLDKVWTREAESRTHRLTPGTQEDGAHIPSGQTREATLKVSPRTQKLLPPRDKRQHWGDWKRRKGKAAGYFPASKQAARM